MVADRGWQWQQCRINYKSKTVQMMNIALGVSGPWDNSPGTRILMVAVKIFANHCNV